MYGSTTTKVYTEHVLIISKSNHIQLKPEI